MTQEFHLSITALGSDRYLIRTEETAAGVPVSEAQVHWPVDDWLHMAQTALNDPVMGLLQGHLDVSDRPVGLQQLGRELYRALFQDEAIRESWLRAQGIAQNRHEILRLRLGLKESRLQRLPWEVLRHDQQPITTRSNQTFARYAPNLLVGQSTGMQNLPDAGTTIQVLIVIASPQDQDHLQLLQEVRHLQELLDVASDRPTTLHIDVLEQPDRSQLAQKLEQGNYQVLHYAGHSDFGDNGGDLSLVNRQTGLTERLSGDDLAGLLVNNDVALTIFNSCRSGHTAGDDVDMDWRQQNLVQALVNRGVPGVIAMAERIPDEVAIAFTRLFYHNLREGFPIDVSLSRTRQGLISGFGSDQHYWALPILYLHPEFDGYLTKRDRDADDQLDPSKLTAAAVPLTMAPISEADAAVEASTDAPTTAPSGESATPAATADVADLDIPVASATTLLTQLDATNSTESSDDALLVDYVQQLSQNSPEQDEPLIKADAEEQLLDENSHRAGMALYESLPDVPLPSEHESSSATAASNATDTAHTVEMGQPPLSQTALAQESLPQSTAPQQQLYTLPKRSFLSQRQPEKPILVWFALGLVGIVGVLGLSWLALRWSSDRATSPPSEIETVAPTPEPSPAEPAASTLIRQAENAITDRRYDDARQKFERALTQSLRGKANQSDVSNTIWPWVSESGISELEYVKGRIAWQEVAEIESEIEDFESRYQQATFRQQAREAWAQTDDTFIEGRVARGFAAYADGDWDEAIDHWEAALALYEDQRERQPNPAGNTVAEPIILHAYAGLVMAYTTVGNINPIGLAEDDRLQGASDRDQAILNAEAERELSFAREYFLRLQELDELEWMTPAQLGLINESPHTWNNWLWTADLLEDWQRDYRYWDDETSLLLDSQGE